MHQRTGILLLVLGGILITTSVMAQTQSANDVLVYDNQSDFLLPSYFDTPPQQTAAMQRQNTTPTQNAQPQNVPADIDILNEIFGDQAIPAQTQKTTPPRTNTKVFYPTPKSVRADKEIPMLTPLPPLATPPEPAIAPTKRISKTSPYATKLVFKETENTKQNIKLPKEIRLQFSPDSTQLTGSALQWISAYALHVKKNPTLIVNIRVSNQNWRTQQARLGLIIQALVEKGLPTSQLHIFQSTRDPDTLVIGMDTSPDQTQIITPDTTKKIIKEQKTFSW